jgi:hypothetical protein
MATLFPRLMPSDAISLWEDLREKSVEELRYASSNSHPGQYYAAVGGARVEPSYLTRLAASLRGIAEDAGYPDRKTSLLREFDINATKFLAEEMTISDGEALRKETWSFISLVLLPDIVKWRFPDFHVSRCTGGRRDCFHRLWLRSKAFDLGPGLRNRWVLLQHLTEDFFVSVMERPSLAGNPILCRVIGLTWVTTATKIGRGSMEDVNRRAIKRIRATATLLHLDSIEYANLKNMVAECFDLEAAEMR